MKSRTLALMCSVIIALQVISMKFGQQEAVTQLSDEQLEQIIFSVSESVIDTLNSNSAYSDLETSIDALSYKFNDTIKLISANQYLVTETNSPGVGNREQNIISNNIDLKGQADIEEQRQESVRIIEERIAMAVGNGQWSYDDSESIIQYVGNISLEDRMYLLDILSEAIDNGLTSVDVYPPPL